VDHPRRNLGDQPGVVAETMAGRQLSPKTSKLKSGTWETPMTSSRLGPQRITPLGEYLFGSLHRPARKNLVLLVSALSP